MRAPTIRQLYVKKKSTSNPFDDLTMALEYEDWYSTSGSHADRLEKDFISWMLAKFRGNEYCSLSFLIQKEIIRVLIDRMINFRLGA